MKSPDQNDQKIERLLYDKLSGDPPAEVEKEMRGQLLEFRRQIDKYEREETQKSADAGPMWIRLFRERMGFACASLAVLCLVVLQLAGTQSSLAATINAMQSPTAAAEAIQRAESMQCRVNVEDGVDFNYKVYWNASGGIRIDLENEGQVEKTWLIQEESVTVIKNGQTRSLTLDKYLSEADVENRLVYEFGTPAGLVDSLKYFWIESPTPSAKDKEPVRYELRNRPDYPLIQMSTDRDSRLPILIQFEKGKRWSFHYRWNVPLGPEAFRENNSAASVSFPPPKIGGG